MNLGDLLNAVMVLDKLNAVDSKRKALSCVDKLLTKALSQLTDEGKEEYKDVEKES